MANLTGREKSHALFELRIAKAFADPLRIKILAELNMRDMSAKQFFEEFGGGSLTRVWRHFQALKKYDWIEKVAEKSGGSRRGATEHFYRATGPAMFDTEAWSGVPESMKAMFSWRVFETFAEQVREALGGSRETTSETLDPHP
jgi:hypothetical protein